MPNYTFVTPRFARKTTWIVISLSLVLLSGLLVLGKRLAQPKNEAAAAPATAHLQENYGQVPLHFEANQGQFSETVKYLSRGKGYSIAFTPQAAVLELQGERSATVQMKLKGANRNARITSSQPLEAKMNYFLGNDPKQWKTDVPTFAKVKYEQVYPGTDVVYYGNQQQLEYDFIVAPQADPRAIKLEFDGVTDLRLDETGNLLLSTEAGEVKQHKPIIYQEVAGNRREIRGSYRIEQREVGFELGEYDRSLPLVIDPVVSYATLVSSSGVFSTGIAVDNEGNAFLAGYVYPKQSIPTTPGAIQSNSDRANSNSAFGYVAKFNSTGTKMLYGAMIGGSTPIKNSRGEDVLDTRFNGIAIDSSGNAYLTGTTMSADFPTTPGAVQGTYIPIPGSSVGAFALKLNPTGSALVYSTLLGNGSDGRAIAVDAEGQAVVTGETFKDIPVKEAFQAANRGYSDAFVTKLNATGTELIFSTYLGSAGRDKGLDVAVDEASNAYLTGETFNGYDSSDKPWGTRFPTTPGAFQTSQVNAVGIYVSKFNPQGNLIYSTLILDSILVHNQTHSIAVDKAGGAYIQTFTGKNTYPTTPGAYQTKFSASCEDCFSDTVLTKLSADGSSLVYSTYFGTDKVYDTPGGLAVDADGNAYIANNRGYDNEYGVSLGDTQIVKLNAQGNAVLYSFIALRGCRVTGLALDPARNVYIAGDARPANDGFAPTPGAYWTSGRGAFVAKITDTGPPPAAAYNISGTVTFQNGKPSHTPMAGVKVYLFGTVTRTATTDSNGRYVFSDLPRDGNYSVLIDPMNYDYLPRITSVKNLSASQVMNFDVYEAQKVRLITNVSAASYKTGPLAADSIVSAFGSDLTTVTETASQLPLPTDMGGTQVRVADSTGAEKLAALFFVSPTQVNFALPSGLASGPAIITIVAPDQSKSKELIQIEPISPGLFSADASGRGYAAANVQRVKANGLRRFEDIARYDAILGKMVPIPIDLGPVGDEVYLALYGTGVRNRRDLASVSATVGGIPVTITYVGSQVSYVGLDQINIKIPRELAGRGDVNVMLSVEGRLANTVRVKIK